MATYTIDPTQSEAYEAGAILIALLAYPRDDEIDAARSHLQASVSAFFLHCRAAVDHAWVAAPQAMKPIYLLRDAKQIARDLRTLDRRLRDRLAAAKMAIPYFCRAATGQTRVPAAAGGFSLNKLAEVVAADLGLSQADTIETRLWRCSLPVIHLATALACLMDHHEKRADRPLNLFDFLINRDLHKAIIEWAEAYEQMLIDHRLFGIDPARIVRLRLAG